MAESSKNNVREATFKKWPFACDFTYEVEDGIVISAKCKYCSEVEYNKFFCEAKRRNLKGQALKSLESYQSNVTYILHKTLKRHVGEVNSIHNWCKKTFLQPLLQLPILQIQINNQSQQMKTNVLMTYSSVLRLSITKNYFQPC